MIESDQVLFALSFAKTVRKSVKNWLAAGTKQTTFATDNSRIILTVNFIIMT